MEEPDLDPEHFRPLAKELVLHIAENLPIATLARFCRVSRGFRTWTLPILLRHVSLLIPTDIERFDSSIASKPELTDHVRGLSFSFFLAMSAPKDPEINALKRIVMRCKKLQSLKIPNVPPGTRKDFFTIIFSKDLVRLEIKHHSHISVPELVCSTFPRLQTLVLYDYESDFYKPTPCRPSESLRHICFNEAALYPEDLKWWFMHCVALESLELELKYEEISFSGADIRDVFRHAPKTLCRLRLVVAQNQEDGSLHMDGSGTDFLYNIFDACTTIRALQTDTYFCSHEFLHHFGPRLIGLEITMISGCISQTLECLIACLVEAEIVFPRLRALELFQQDNASLLRITRSAIVRLTDLKKIHLKILSRNYYY